MSALPSAAAALLRKTYAALAPRNWKYRAEVAFWRREIENYDRWYRGELPVHFGTPSPRDSQKLSAPTAAHRAILTWGRLHQEAKYLHDLDLPADAYAGRRLLDVGSGPIPSAAAFRGSELYCVDPLFDRYLQAGFPLHYYPGVRFVHGYAERMPLEDAMFDAVISVNAIDHVDDFEAVAGEIQRVLRPGGQLRMHVHYHTVTATEPLELNDARVAAAYSWCAGFRKLRDSSEKFGSVAAPGETYALWSNF